MQVFTCPCDVPSHILSLIPGLEQNTCCGLLFLSASISSLSHRSSPPGSPPLLYTNPQSQQALPGNLSGTMTREDGKKTAYVYVFFLSSKSNPLVSSSAMQHTTCYRSQKNVLGKNTQLLHSCKNKRGQQKSRNKMSFNKNKNRHQHFNCSLPKPR